MPLLPTLRNLANAANQQAEAQKMAVAEAEKKQSIEQQKVDIKKQEVALKAKKEQSDIKKQDTETLSAELDNKIKKTGFLEKFLSYTKPKDVMGTGKPIVDLGSKGGNEKILDKISQQPNPNAGSASQKQIDAQLKSLAPYKEPPKAAAPVGAPSAPKLSRSGGGGDPIGSMVPSLEQGARGDIQKLLSPQQTQPAPGLGLPPMPQLEGVGPYLEAPTRDLMGASQLADWNRQLQSQNLSECC